MQTVTIVAQIVAHSLHLLRVITESPGRLHIAILSSRVPRRLRLIAMLAMKWVPFDDQVGDFLVVVDDFDGGVDAFAHFFVGFGRALDISVLQVRQQLGHQAGYSCE